MRFFGDWISDSNRSARLGLRLGWAGLICVLGLNAGQAGSVDGRARAFIDAHVQRVRPIELAANRAWWDANLSGQDSDFKRKEDLQNQLDAALADRARFAELRSMRQARVKDRLLARQIDLLYLMYLEKQVDPALLRRIAAKANAVEQAFNVFRARLDGREITDSALREVLKTSRDSRQRKAAWEASKAVGSTVHQDLLELVRLRNEAARSLGQPHFHALQLFLNEQDPKTLLALFDELERLTREPFRTMKAALDAKLAQQSHVRVEALRPWHYHDPFFQESPAVYDTDLDSVYVKTDILQLCRDYFTGVGLPIDAVLARSDLHEKPGKSPHAFCSDIDREGDVRVLANIAPTEYWMGTMLHELGHAVYSSTYIPRTLPYLLRREAHIMATEGVAMLFERPSKSADWLKSRGVSIPDPAAFNAVGRRMHRNQLLIFSRWCQVMFRFEKAMYENPDQDLNRLWWDLVERFQMIPRPEGRNAPDYANKIHVVSAPAYYHNYMLGQLFASQVFETIARTVLKQPVHRALLAGDRRIGEFMQRRVFDAGNTMDWNELTRHATGKKLNARAFAAELRTDSK